MNDNDKDEENKYHPTIEVAVLDGSILKKGITIAISEKRL